MTNTIFILKLNGLNYLVQQAILLSDLLEFLDIDTNGIAIEYNRLILTEKQYYQTLLKSNDQIEIVSIVGGG